MYNMCIGSSRYNWMHCVYRKMVEEKNGAITILQYYNITILL